MKTYIDKILCFLFFLIIFCYGENLKYKFVWIFGFDLRKDVDFQKILEIVETAYQNNYNGIVLSAGLDSLCKKDEKYFSNLKKIKEFCDNLNIEIIPSIFSIGYGGGILAHNKYLAEGLPVKDALFIVKDKEAIFTPDLDVKVKNGDFEEFEGNKFKNFVFHDEPGKISFVDTEIKKSGRSSIRFENFNLNPYGHGRIMQEILVKPYRCYRVNLWIKTENLTPASSFRIVVLGVPGNKELSPRTFNIPQTTDWRKLTMIFNSMEYEKIRLYAGVWEAKGGKFWLDDWSIEEIGPINVLRRKGTPIVVKSEDTGKIYEEGIDYEPLIDSNFNLWTNFDRPYLKIRLKKETKIKDGERLRVSWYHPMLIYDSQVVVCMGEEEVYEIFEHEAKLLWETLRYKKVLLSMDEVRMGGTCEACKGKDIAELLGECITREVRIIRKFNPETEIYIWSDMFDPNHNAKNNYYLVRGDLTGSWNYISKDLIMVVWGSEPREKSLEFFLKENFKVVIACYYDADIEKVKEWYELSKKYNNVIGFMYTTWQKKYDFLKEFAKIINF